MGVVEGDLTLMSFSDLLQWISMSSKTGLLELKRENEVKEIYFFQGEAYLVSSNDDDERFGARMVNKGFITQEQLDKILQAQRIRRISHRSGGTKNLPKIGQILHEYGLISRKELQEQVADHLKEVILSIFSWEEGKFTFTDEVPNLIEPNSVMVKVDEILFKGVQYGDEWKRIKSFLPSSSVILKKGKTPWIKSSIENLKPLYIKILKAFKQAQTPKGIARIIHEEPFVAYNAIADLISMKFFEVDQGSVKDIDKVDPAQIEVWLNTASDAMKWEDFETALENLMLALEADPNLEKARQLQKDFEKTLMSKFLMNIGSLSRIPKLNEKELARFTKENKLSSEYRKILNFVDSSRNINQIIDLTGLHKLKALVIIFILFKNHVLIF